GHCAAQENVRRNPGHKKLISGAACNDIISLGKGATWPPCGAVLGSAGFAYPPGGSGPSSGRHAMTACCSPLRKSCGVDYRGGRGWVKVAGPFFGAIHPARVGKARRGRTTEFTCQGLTRDLHVPEGNDGAPVRCSIWLAVLPLAATKSLE